MRDKLLTPVFLGFPDNSNGEESACSAGDLGSIPGLRRSHKGGHGNTLQYSCRGHPMDRAARPGYSPGNCEELGSEAQHSTDILSDQ